MVIAIDANSGFCFGVVRAVKLAEEELAKGNSLYCLGEIVHNQSEVERLKSLGLIFIDHTQFKELKNVKVLIRAHGEPPSTYEIARQNNLQIVDASCKVVLNLQQRVRMAYEEMISKQGQIVIFGKVDHPEVIGLVGQTNQQAIVVSDENCLDKINFNQPIRLFAQTTKSIHDFRLLIHNIEQGLNKSAQTDFKANETICKQVSNREASIRDFATSNELILFVGGKKSSNAKFLFDLCYSENKNTKFISDISDIECSWFNKINTVGITGATSTPNWLMEEVKRKIESKCI